MRREHKQDNANPESAGALSTHIYASAYPPPIHNPFLLKNPPSYSKQACSLLPETHIKQHLKTQIPHFLMLTGQIPHIPLTLPRSYSSLCVHLCAFTCWSTPTASRPSYMMLTHPSLHDSTNSDISAYKIETPPLSQVLFKSRYQSHVTDYVCAKPAPGCQSCTSADSSDTLLPDTAFYW